jgi:hypothetical protein
MSITVKQLADATKTARSSCNPLIKHAYNPYGINFFKQHSPLADECLTKAGLRAHVTWTPDGPFELVHHWHGSLFL